MNNNYNYLFKYILVGYPSIYKEIQILVKLLCYLAFFIPWKNGKIIINQLLDYNLVQGPSMSKIQ